MTTAALSAYPFGSPDAGNEAPNPSPFVSVDGPPGEAGVSAADVDPTVRVMVGRMGAGKTRCLVELRDSLASAPAYDVTPIDFDLPSLTPVTRLAESLSLEPTERGEVWGKLWRRAIVRAALSRAMQRPSGGAGSTELRRRVAEVRELDPPLVPSPIPRSIYAEFGAILRDHPTLVDLRRFLDDTRWDEVDDCLRQLLERRREPLCFFLDTGEEDSSHAPRYWLWCQLGLVREVLHLAQRETFAEKLWIFVAVRDQTFAELVKAARPTMYEQHPRVRQIRWGPRSAALFLAEKIRRLPDDYLICDRRREAGLQALVLSWLGTATMPNGPRQAEEPITVYLLRHTRLIPRDIVSIGNLLTIEVLAAQGRKDPAVPAHCIANAVAKSARLSATEELQACALEVIAQQLAGVQRASQRRRIVPDEDAAARTLEMIKELLGRCEEDVVARDVLEAVDAEARARFGADVLLSDLLWRRGLIGWSGSLGGPFVFGSIALPTQPSSRRARYVAFHPCLVDELVLEPAAEDAVVPFPREALP